MANGYIARGTDSGKVLAYVLRDSETERLVAHTRLEGEPEDEAGVLGELKKAGVPPTIAFIVHGVADNELQAAALRLYKERVELEFVGVVE